MQIFRSFKFATNLGQQIANLKFAKNIGAKICKSANCHTCGRSANVTNFVSPKICGFPEAWGKMIHEKTWKQKILWHCPFEAKHQCTQEYNDVTSQNFIKILSIEIIPLKSRVNGFLKINIQEFIFQYRAFTKSIISHPFLNHFHRNNSIYKISTPSNRGKEEICRRMPRNFFSSAQFQRKRKSLVFFQSINFLWRLASVFIEFNCLIYWHETWCTPEAHTNANYFLVNDKCCVIYHR